jgi:N-acetylglucosamine-6-phosphate deacetylase
MACTVVPAGMFLSGSALPTRMSASGPEHHRRAHLQPHRLQNVALLAVGVVHQRDARRAVGIVLDRRHLARHAILLALEIDRAQLLLVPAAVMADGQVARVAASARALARRQQRLVRRRSVVRSSVVSEV